MTMKTATVLMTLMLGLAACKEKVAVTTTTPAAPAATTPAAPDNSVPALTSQGYGSVRFGQTLSDVEQALGEKAQSRGESDPACTYVKFDKLPGARFMVETGVITRAEADAGIPNELGVAVGDTVEQAKAKYPAVQVGPHKYVPDGNYLTFKKVDSNNAIVMEAEGSKITRIRSGIEPAVSYVEGCQ
ncbi:hypothetical protein [Massilia soli]|uniref:Lipoprotein n=1 Tax=Massilia soli TaxID=2792854 RepID=A0ABS7SNH1_9BURK|nr:hypothetical protein [Massilia soli]MBZ2207469.1 hypothetical protein [Massilia soli]